MTQTIVRLLLGRPRLQLKAQLRVTSGLSASSPIVASPVGDGAPHISLDTPTLFASPDFTGTPTAPTQTALLNSTALATTAYVDRTTREKLTAARTYYVRTDGSDSNNGLANTAGGAFLTIQAAVTAVLFLDCGIYLPTISVGAGTYAPFTVGARHFGTVNGIAITGDAATPSNVVISGAAACITISSGGSARISGFKLTSSASHCVFVDGAGSVFRLNGLMEFGTVGSGARHIYISNSAYLTVNSNYTISGSAQNHILMDRGAAIECSSKTITLTGTPAWTSGFIDCQLNAAIRHFGCTFSGAATGARYSVTLNGSVQTFGGGASYFPGDSAGSTATGGQYA